MINEIQRECSQSSSSEEDEEDDDEDPEDDEDDEEDEEDEEEDEEPPEPSPELTESMAKPSSSELSSSPTMPNSLKRWLRGDACVPKKRRHATTVKR